MAVKQLPKISPIPEPPNRLVGDQERFDTMTFNSLKAQEKMVNDDLNKTLIPALNEFAVDVNASVDAAALSERNAHDSEEVAKRKAGEASGSAGAAKVSEDNAKVSETNALASKNAAALSAESAESARIAAEAARDEAQDLANVGYVSEGHAGLAKVDGKTTQADAGGVITAKDVAIGGDLGDLASARGQIGAARELGNNVDYNTVTEAGFYLINATGGVNGPIVGSAAFLQVFYSKKDAFTKNLYQIVYAYSSARERMFLRQYRLASNDWSSWSEIVSSSRIGDGLTVNNGIISVPEYEGATISAAGTSGLVPPAAAGQQESFLTGGGEYKPALTKISDSVNLADSKMAASAKAVKTAYDLAADAKQKSNTSGTADYANGLRGIPLQWVGRGASPEFLLGRLGQEPFDAFRPMHIEGVGSAKAWKAQNSGGNYVLYDEILGENPTYIMGYALNGIFKIYTTSALSVNYANSAGSAPANGGTSWATAVMPNVAFVGRDGAIPNGGTWLYIYMPYDSHYLRGVTLAGGATAPSNDGGIAIRVA
ncbi:tail fiber protein [Bilophila wadsworthia]|uniref:tail fiber protein n=1 Tax=Bilophila wadsworthia TaxID=35833 RepID=UPI003AB7253D